LSSVQCVTLVNSDAGSISAIYPTAPAAASTAMDAFIPDAGANTRTRPGRSRLRSALGFDGSGRWRLASDWSARKPPNV
jgi:hypothetical protein